MSDKRLDLVAQAISHQRARAKSLLLPPLAVFLLLTLGCSAAGLLQRETPTPEPVGVLVPTFTPTTAASQSLIIITPPSQGQPGVIIIPPGMDPNSVVPVLPTPVPTFTPEPSSTLAATETPTETPPPTNTVLPVQIGTTSATQPIEPSGPTATITPILLDSQPTAEGVSPQLPTPTPEQVLVVFPTETATPGPTFTPTIVPTPFIVVESGLVSLRTGPGVEFPLFAQLGPGIPVAVIGQHPDGRWYQICCISGETVWVAAQHVNVVNPLTSIPQVGAGPPPSPTPTFTPTETGTPTLTPTATPFPFERAIGPQFFPTNNDFLTIWVKFFVGTPPDEEAAADHYITVLFEGVERFNSLGLQPSKGVFEESGSAGAGNRVEYNLKYEYRPPDPRAEDPNSDLTRLQLLGTGTWTVYVSDAMGNPLSEEVNFTTTPSNPNREVYLGWARVR